MSVESGEFIERAELVCVGRSESKTERPARGCWSEAASWFQRRGEACRKDRSVICKDDDEGGWEFTE